VPAIVKELVIANESRKRAAVVIVSDTDKSEMEETLRGQIDDFKTTRMVCRHGDPWLPRNLEMANVRGARSIIVVEEGSDASTVKVLLAIRAAQHDDPSPAHVVAELIDADTARSLRSLMGDRLVTVSSDDVVAELTAQACRQRGLSTVFHELLDFDGDELYFAPFPELTGRSFADAQLAFEKCAVIGVLDGAGTVALNPPAETVLGNGDQLIAIVEDDSLFLVAPISATPRVLPVAPRTRDEVPRRIVIVGWSTLGPRVIAELDEFMDSRTTIELLLDPTKVDVASVRATVSARNVLVEVSELAGGPELVAAHAARISFNEVIVLGYRDALDDNAADATTLLTLLAFRQVRQSEDVGPVRMVAELLDQRHAPLAEASGADDFIVSDELTSLMLAQLSERRELDQVFIDLFDREGCSIELREAAQYGGQEATTFADVVATASSQGHSAFGFRRGGTGEVVVNPAKSAPLRLGVEDEILVLAPGHELAAVAGG
jgi:Trk K+ transport system NAD-binding subunit